MTATRRDPAPPASTIVFSYERWHENFLRLVLAGATAAGLVVSIASIVDVVRAGTRELAFVYGTAWLVLLAINIRRLPYALRAWVLLALTYGLAVSGLLENGMRGDARLFFLGLTIMTAMLIGIRAALAAAVASVVTIAVVGSFALAGVLKPLSKVTAFGTPELWVVSTLSLALLQTIVLLGLYLFLREFTAAQAQVQRSLGELGAERTLLRTVIDNIPDPVYSKDVHGRRQVANRADARMLGKEKAEEALGMTGAENLSETEAVRLLADDRTVLAGGVPLINREVSLAGPDGQLRWLLESKIPLRSASGEIVGLVGIDRDITERRRGEEERSRLEDQLRLAQRMESMGRLAGGIAHDINNLLAPILGYAELLLDERPSEEELSSGLQQIRDAAQRARDLARQLLVFGRQQALKREAVDLRDVLGRFERLLRGMVRDDIRLELRRPPSLAGVAADVHAVEQVVMNLVLNAQEAMAGGGTLTLELADQPLDADSAAAHPGLAAGEYVVLRVTDTGTGMDEATAARIFEPFFTTKPRGTGLGLSTVYSLVQQHGGTVEVDSVPGQGTTFTIFLPRSAADPAPARPAPAVRPAAEGRGRDAGRHSILVVDDTEGVRDLVARALRRVGYQVSTAASPEEALRISSAADAAIDLLVTDVVMPGMDGAQLSGEVSRRRPGVKTLFMSGHTSEVLARHGYQPGAALLKKPFLLSDLARAVHEALESHGNL